MLPNQVLRREEQEASVLFRIFWDWDDQIEVIQLTDNVGTSTWKRKHEPRTNAQHLSFQSRANVTILWQNTALSLLLKMNEDDEVTISISSEIEQQCDRLSMTSRDGSICKHPAQFRFILFQIIFSIRSLVASRIFANLP